MRNSSKIVRTPAEIEAEIAEVIRVKGLIKPVTLFNESNEDAADASIRVLNSRMTVDEVYEEYADEPQNVMDAARDTAEWLEGETEETWSEGWEV